MALRIRARHLRAGSQALFLVAFLVLFWGLAFTRVRGEVAAVLLALDPLTAVGTALADWTVPRWTWLGLVVLGLTAVLGRFFCGWLCPLGTLQHLVGWVAGSRKAKRLIELNRYRRWFSLKYVVLAVLLTWAALGANHLGWLDPIPLLHRAVASGVRPLWHGGLMPAGWVSFGMLAAILLLAAWMPRLYCRAVCPLGALLGLFARLAPLRIRRDGPSCSGCTLCAIPCQGADEPLGDHRVSECHVCLNCLPVCKESSLRYGLAAAPPALATPALDVGRRRFLISLVGAAAVAPVLEVAGSGRTARRHDAIRPPGALDEEAFLARCVTCGACSASCPTGVIVADVGRSGVEGLFTPVMLMRRGWCEPSCVRCGEVCPTGALAVLDPAAKQTIGEPAAVKIGTAFLDWGRCLPWAMARPCIVCEEMCPTSPKAIWLETVEVPGRDDVWVTVQRPHVDPELCTGCGLCENRCPVGEEAAIRVSSVGETRDPSNWMLQRKVLAG